MHTARRSAVTLAAVLVAVVLAGCATGAAASPSLIPGAPSASSDPDTSTGTAAPAGGDPGVGGPGAGRIIVPKPGQLEVRSLPAQSMSASVDGRHAVVTVTFAIGVEPCSILDSVVVERGERSFAIALREGHGPGNEVCIMIAEIARTVVDLGALEPGTYAVSDTTGGAPAISFVVS
jgi:hypothetical protein